MKTADNPHALVYRIDDQGRITYVNPAWSEFARNNQGKPVLPEYILKTSLMASIADMTVRELYRQMIKRARAGSSVQFQYRCDAPDRRRLYGMEISLLASGEVEFASTLVHEDLRPAVALLEPGHARSRALLRVCSWCQKVAMPDGQWLPVEEAVAELRLLETDELPGLTHGICEACQSKLKAEIGLE